MLSSVCLEECVCDEIQALGDHETTGPWDRHVKGPHTPPTSRQHSQLCRLSAFCLFVVVLCIFVEVLLTVEQEMLTVTLGRGCGPWAP